MKVDTGHTADKKGLNLTAFIACLAGVVLNLLLGMAVSALGLPLYLDTVGTVFAAASAGYLPGVLVGFMTNIIKSISDPSSIYYGVLNVLIAVCASFLAGKGCFRSLKGSVIAVAVFTLIGGGLGSLIPWFMIGLSYDSEAVSAILYRTGLFDNFSSHLVSSLLQDLPDKAVTVALVMMILWLIVRKPFSYFGLDLWMRETDADKKSRGLKRSDSEVRVMSLRIKTLLVLLPSLVIVAMVGIWISVRIYHKDIVSEHTGLAQGTARLAAKVIDADMVDEYLASSGQAEGYEETKALLADILVSSREISYLYVYRMEKDGFRVVFDIETEDTPAGSIGSILPYDAGFTPYIPALLSGESVEPIITNDRYGYLLTAAEPVFDSSGRCVCYAIADVDMEMLIASELSFLMEMISVFAGFFIVISSFVIWLTDRQIVTPVKSMTVHMNEFTTIGATQEQTDENVRKLRKLDIHTGDEIEKLYNAVCDMTLSQAEQTRSIRLLSESTAKMQEGLIITMADMVENRDSDTGAHIQKTSAYVRIIAEGLLRKGYYPEKLTPQFMSDVVRSAPLHDVGKINIPDGILNKPGKLTPEEFEIMKTHTTAGKRIMEHAISTVKGESYLKEARNMAAYHHERWDGKGYPEGLHGEVIPLSARIMAVADVFDALSSARIYKPAFPLEKALAILEEGSGTQFDPKCVEVFMESLTQVKIVLKQNEQKG